MLPPTLIARDRIDPPTEGEIDLMADVLRNQLGESAADVAHFFSLEQDALGDEDRSKAWADVAHRILKKKPVR